MLVLINCILLFFPTALLKYVVFTFIQLLHSPLWAINYVLYVRKSGLLVLLLLLKKKSMLLIKSRETLSRIKNLVYSLNSRSNSIIIDTIKIKFGMIAKNCVWVVKKSLNKVLKKLNLMPMASWREIIRSIALTRLLRLSGESVCSLAFVSGLVP